MKDDRFGINIKRYCRDHEASVKAALDGNSVTNELLEEHYRMISTIQHERLVHLIVTVMVVIVELFVTDLTLLHSELGIIPAIAMLCLAVLLGFYFYHYFFLENTLQRWYKLTDEIRKRL